MLYNRDQSNNAIFLTRFTLSNTFRATAKLNLLTGDSHLTLHIMWEIENEPSKTFPSLGHLEMPMTYHEKESV